MRKVIFSLLDLNDLQGIYYRGILIRWILQFLLVRLVCLLGGRLTILAGSSLPRNLVTLMGNQLSTVEIDLSIMCDETHHLVMCGRDDLHAVQPGTPQDSIEGG